MIRAIGDNIVELSVVALAAFFIWGAGLLIITSEERSQIKYERCIEAEMQWVSGGCVR